MDEYKSLGEVYREASKAFDEFCVALSNLPNTDKIVLFLESVIEWLSEWLKEINGKKSEKDN